MCFWQLLLHYLQLGLAHVTIRQLFIAGVYLWNYYMPQSANVLNHTWSLSLEEQFYLCWPACIKFMKPSRALKLAIGIILLEPFIRTACYVAFPHLRGTGKISSMFHTRMDTIMFGCVIAMIWKHARFKAFTNRYIRSIAFLAALLFLFAVGPSLNIFFRSFYHALWFTLDGVALSIILIYLVGHPKTNAGRIMNVRPLRYLGTLSYSLYLWQQLFVDFWPSRFPLNLLAAFGCSLLSFLSCRKAFSAVARPVLAKRTGPSPVVHHINLTCAIRLCSTNFQFRGKPL